MNRPALDIARVMPQALALHQAGRFTEAIPLYRQVTAAAPHIVQAHANLGMALAATGQIPEAIASYRRALDLAPDLLPIRINLCVLLLEGHQPTEAVDLCRAGLAQQPHPDLYFHLGNGLRRQGQLEPARQAFTEALALRPDFPDALLNLAGTLQLLGHPAQALPILRRLVVACPDFPVAHANLGTALQELGHTDEALTACRRAVALAPDNSAYHGNLGALLVDLEQYDAAMGCFQRALALDPGNLAARLYRGFAHLRAGRFIEGWADCECRFQAKRAVVPGAALGSPPWTGEPLQGRTLLLVAEQGLGDSLQFIRFVPALQALGARVVAHMPAALVPLLRVLPGLDRVESLDQPPPAHDLHLPLLSLPHRLGITLDDLPFRSAYLQPSPEAVARWRGRLDGLTGRRVGLVWSGDPRQHNREAHLTDRRRSLTLDAFAFLADIPGLSLVNLQLGTPAAQLAEPPPGLALFDPMADVTSFADTAAIVAQLDLVITVDTSVAHLAGALGKPVWVLSRFGGCWRWLIGRDDSPWYPALRLFRQTAPGDWGAVLQQVAKALR